QPFHNDTCRPTRQGPRHQGDECTLIPVVEKMTQPPSSVTINNRRYDYESPHA
ncbi:hypothetical protein Pmar_PMAR017198, partial [Perkinsus marinus ATCC 50983]